MGEVIKLNTYRMEKQYKQHYATCNINLALDNVTERKVKRNIAKKYQLAYMKLLSK